MPSLTPLLLLLALAGAPAGTAPATPGVEFPTPTGPVWVETASPGGGRAREAVGRGVLEASPERVFRALVDYAHWPEFMPFLSTSDAKPQPDGSTLAYHVLELPLPTGERHYRLRFRQRVETDRAGRTWRIEWSYVPGSGNIADHHGSWTLTALAGGRTFAVLRLYNDTGGLTPRWAADRGTLETVPWIFHGLRQQVRRSRYDGI
jgi:uncharacterized protein YndB with AHSA1/START domain